MIYKVYTQKFDGFCTSYAENTLYISADSKEEAIEIFKKWRKVRRKKIYADEVHKKGIVQIKEVR